MIDLILGEKMNFEKIWAISDRRQKSQRKNPNL